MPGLVQKVKVANNFIVHHMNLSKDPATQESINIQFIFQDFLNISSQNPHYAVSTDPKLFCHNHPIPIEPLD